MTTQAIQYELLEIVKVYLPSDVTADQIPPDAHMNQTSDHHILDCQEKRIVWI